MKTFLVADKRLYKRLFSVRPSVGRLVGRSVVIELENVKTPLPTRPRLVLAVYPALFFLRFVIEGVFFGHGSENFSPYV